MDVKAVLKATFKTNGVPTILRSDNGPEFIAHDLGEWLAEQGVFSTGHLRLKDVSEGVELSLSV